MKQNKILLSAFCAAAFAFAFSACGNQTKTTDVTVNNSTTNAANTASQSDAGAAAGGTNKSPETNKPAATPNNTAVYTPERNSAERTAIFDALRVPVSKELKQDVQFVAERLKVQGDWAFIAGKAQGAQGGEVNWKVTKYQEDIDNGVFDDNLFALLKKSGDRWSVVTYAIGCTDVCYEGWAKQYKAPKAIFE
jgi:hypothetical protein